MSEQVRLHGDIQRALIEANEVCDRFRFYSDGSVWEVHPGGLGEGWRAAADVRPRSATLGPPRRESGEVMTLIDHEAGCATLDGAPFCNCGVLEALTRPLPAPKPPPGVHPTAFIHPSARVEGDARLSPPTKAPRWRRWLDWLRPPSAPNERTTPLKTATIGARTKVWQFASIGAGTVIGEDCSIWPHVMLDGPVFGDRCKVASFVAMGAGFRIGNDVFIGPSVTFANDVWPRTDQTGWDVGKLRDGSLVTIIVEDGASIGANAVVLPGVRIGAGAMVAAGAVCGADVPPGCLFKRNGQIVEINPAWTKRRMRAAR
ncbi:MAG: DapH/DapD/GlmU-related protein [Trueperaceae bacterium]